MAKWSKRTKAAVGIIALNVLDKTIATAFGINFENLLAKAGAANLFVEGAPGGWRVTMAAASPQSL